MPGAHILVVDDDDMVRPMTVRMLQHLGLDPVGVASGEEAISVFEADVQSFSAILLDVNLPGIDGESTLERLRALRPELPCVFFSGGHRRDFLDAQTAFLSKPFSLASLREALNQVMGEGS